MGNSANGLDYYQLDDKLKDHLNFFLITCLEDRREREFERESGLKILMKQIRSIHFETEIIHQHKHLLSTIGAISSNAREKTRLDCNYLVTVTITTVLDRSMISPVSSQ